MARERRPAGRSSRAPTATDSTEELFALKGGTAIKLFHWDRPRYRRMDLTHLPIRGGITAEVPGFFLRGWRT